MSRKGKVCLLIDDDIDDIEIFGIAIDELGKDIKCFTAIDGAEALKMLGNENFVPDYIFLDLNMPRMNGKQCLIEIKKIPRLAQVPVIMYSTSSSQRDVDETKKLGATFFLTKPSTISSLTEILGDVFSHGYLKTESMQ